MGLAFVFLQGTQLPKYTLACKARKNNFTRYGEKEQVDGQATQAPIAY